MVSVETYEQVKYACQKTIIPIIFVIGLIGNSITILVLTRKSMRSSTNVYLTALAVIDMLFLTTSLLMTFQHYKSFNLHHPLYWEGYGYIIWLHDALSYISIYIATCFTLERFIAVRYPIRRQQFCTEALAKKVIIGISIFCTLLTISTAFEYTVNVREKYYNPETNQPCSNDMSKNQMINITELSNIVQKQEDDFIVGRALPTTLDNEIVSEVNLQQRNYEENLSNANNYTENCVNYYHVIYTDLADNDLYQNIFFHFTIIIFVFIPLIILITFNTFLVILVKKSRTLRTDMTKMSIRTTKTLIAKTSKVSQENKITIVLIAVVILFILCQLPWAIFLIISDYIEDFNLRRLLGNIFNLLNDINSASNFFLYCVLSDKYRKTFKELIYGFKHRRRHQFNSSYSTTGLKTRNGSRYFSSTNTGTTTVDC